MQRIGTTRWGRIILEVIPILVLIVSIVFDQLTKVWCYNLYQKNNGTTTVVDNFFYLTIFSILKSILIFHCKLGDGG